MFFLLFLAWMFMSTLAAQVPVCKKVTQSGYFTQMNDQHAAPIAKFSFDLSVSSNNNNPSFPNTLTVSNFSEWYLNTANLLERTSDFAFTFFGNPNKKIDCPSMSNCSFQFPNGEILYYFNYYYIGSPESQSGQPLFVADGVFFNGETSELWNPSNLTCLNSNSESDNAFFWGTTCCTNFENINIPDSGSNNDNCILFETNLIISDPSLSTKLSLQADYYVLPNNNLKIEIAMLTAPDPAYIYYFYVGYPFYLYVNGSSSNPNTSLSIDLIDGSQYEILFDYNSTAIDAGTGIFKYGGINVGEIIFRNGMFLKNMNETFAAMDTCWTKNASVPFTNATYNARFCCANFPPVTSTPAPVDPRSNAIGSLCSNNTKQAWLDIVFVVDTSSAMGDDQLKAIGGEIATLMAHFTMDQTGDHTTRAAIVIYANDASSIYDLTDVTNYTDFLKFVIKLGNYTKPGDSQVNVQVALNFAFNLLKNQTSYRVKTMVLFAAAYNEDGHNGAEITAKQIKESGTSIVVVNYADQNTGALTTALKNISSPGYYYVSNDPNLFLSLSYALAQINCICHYGWTQMNMTNTAWKNITRYADCYYSDGSGANPTVASYVCSPGTLIALTNPAKFDLIENFLTHVLVGKKFTIGLHRSTTNSSIWNWTDYDGSEYPLGDYPVMGQTPAPDDDYGYMFNYYSFNWELLTANEAEMAYICQKKACDAENICDPSQT